MKMFDRIVLAFALVLIPSWGLLFAMPFPIAHPVTYTKNSEQRLEAILCPIEKWIKQMNNDESQQILSSCYRALKEAPNTKLEEIILSCSLTESEVALSLFNLTRIVLQYQLDSDKVTIFIMWCAVLEMSVAFLNDGKERTCFPIIYHLEKKSLSMTQFLAKKCKMSEEQFKLLEFKLLKFLGFRIW